MPVKTKAASPKDSAANLRFEAKLRPGLGKSHRHLEVFKTNANHAINVAYISYNLDTIRISARVLAECVVGGGLVEDRRTENNPTPTTAYSMNAVSQISEPSRRKRRI
ncbi:MAG: hypothetical protein V4675_01175 [Verrucomicrobiota bacterium]